LKAGGRERTVSSGSEAIIALPDEVKAAGKRPPTRKFTASGREPGRQAR
jgi:hypothetical protein